MGAIYLPWNPTEDYPSNGRTMNLSYSWTEIGRLKDWLSSIGVDSSRISRFGSGVIIPHEVCLEVADALDLLGDSFEGLSAESFKLDIPRWRHSGGFVQT